MKKILLIMAVVMLAACSQKQQSSYKIYESRVQEFKETSSIEDKKNLLLLWGWQGDDEPDHELIAEDPHAYWLYDCMTTMHSFIESPEDKWAYYLAMDSCVSIYNHRMQRKSGSLSLALHAVDELLFSYTAGSQPQMNSRTFFKQLANELHVMSLYKSIDDYIGNGDCKSTLDGGYAREFKAWQDVVNACERIMYEYTFGQARYSAAPMEMNIIREAWYADRLEVLDKEWDCIVLSKMDTVSVDREQMTDDDLAAIINRFYNNVPTAGWDELYMGWYDDDAQTLQPYLTDPEVQDHVRLLAYHCKQAIKRWQAVRNAIRDSLPQDRQDTYQALTQAMQNRIYAMLVSLDYMYN